MIEIIVNRLDYDRLKKCIKDAKQWEIKYRFYHQSQLH
jgi:hypothetical protein